MSDQQRSADSFQFDHDDWIAVGLTVESVCEGDDASVALDRFQASMRGPGIIPWSVDYDALEEAWFSRLLTSNIDPVRPVRTLRAMAKKARDVAEQEYEPLRSTVLGLSGTRFVDPNQLPLLERCPLDLNAAYPVPPDILALGREHPDAAAWLWSHWGTTDGLRQVTYSRPRPTRLHYAFFAANWTPWRAFARIAQSFPDLKLSLVSNMK
ncbi:MAG: hypothetical protein PHZ23_15460 [Acidiphilium sp.]|nr:hypothetical protein [Acidiphilium sp.]